MRQQKIAVPHNPGPATYEISSRLSSVKPKWFFTISVSLRDANDFTHTNAIIENQDKVEHYSKPSLFYKNKLIVL